MAERETTTAPASGAPTDDEQPDATRTAARPSDPDAPGERIANNKGSHWTPINRRRL